MGLHGLLDCVVPGLTWLSLFYLIQPEGKVYLCSFIFCLCSDLKHSYSMSKSQL